MIAGYPVRARLGRGRDAVIRDASRGVIGVARTTALMKEVSGRADGTSPRFANRKGRTGSAACSLSVPHSDRRRAPDTCFRAGGHIDTAAATDLLSARQAGPREASRDQASCRRPLRRPFRAIHVCCRSLIRCAPWIRSRSLVSRLLCGRRRTPVQPGLPLRWLGRERRLCGSAHGVVGAQRLLAQLGAGEVWCFEPFRGLSRGFLRPICGR